MVEVSATDVFTMRVAALLVKSHCLQMARPHHTRIVALPARNSSVGNAVALRENTTTTAYREVRDEHTDPRDDG